MRSSVALHQSHEPSGYTSSRTPELDNAFLGLGEALVFAREQLLRRLRFAVRERRLELRGVALELLVRLGEAGARGLLLDRLQTLQTRRGARQQVRKH